MCTALFVDFMVGLWCYQQEILFGIGAIHRTLPDLLYFLFAQSELVVLKHPEGCLRDLIQ